MKKSVILSGCVLLAISTVVAASSASPLKDALIVWDFGDGAELQTHGAVKTGVRFENGATGVVFDGGWLDAGESAGRVLDQVPSYAFTLHVRLRVPGGQWDSPLITKHGGRDKLAWNCTVHLSAGIRSGRHGNSLSRTTGPTAIGKERGMPWSLNWAYSRYPSTWITSGRVDRTGCGIRTYRMAYSA